MVMALVCEIYADIHIDTHVHRIWQKHCPYKTDFSYNALTVGTESIQIY